MNSLPSLVLSPGNPSPDYFVELAVFNLCCQLIFDARGGPTSVVSPLNTTVNCRQKSKVCWEPLCHVPAEVQAKNCHCKSDGKEATSLPDITNCQLCDHWCIYIPKIGTTLYHIICTCVGYIAWQSRTAGLQVQFQVKWCSGRASLLVQGSWANATVRSEIIGKHWWLIVWGALAQQDQPVLYTPCCP